MWGCKPEVHHSKDKKLCPWWNLLLLCGYGCACVEDGGSGHGRERYLLLLILLFDSLCACVFVHVTEQKVITLTLWSHMSPSAVRSHTWNITENAQSHLHNTQEINTFTPPRCSLLLSLPRLMRELLLLAEGLLLTPSRSQMIVFAAWGPDPTTPDPVTGTVDLSTGFPQRVGHKERWNCIPNTNISIVYIILNRLSFYLLAAAAVRVWMKIEAVESISLKYCAREQFWGTCALSTSIFCYFVLYFYTSTFQREKLYFTSLYLMWQV